MLLMSRRQSTEQKIEDLTRQLIDITQQLNNLRLQLQRKQQEARTTRRTSLEQTMTRDLQIGDRVEILNNYQNLRGTEGTVIRLLTTFLTIRTDAKREIVRGRQNIGHIQQNNQ